MCGIFSFIKKNNVIDNDAKDLLSSAAATIGHRGPDSFGEYLNQKIYLAHFRLSIHDLSENGSQPMSCKNTGVVLIFNGEIYNYLNLKKNLIEEKCESFVSKTDTEVLLKAYIHYGVKSFSMLNGMFGFVIYDPRIDAVYVVRDRFGVKPIYFSDTDAGFVISSEKKAILKSDKSKREICNQAFIEYWWYGNALGGNSFYHGIEKLRPGHYIQYFLKTSTYKIHQYHSFSNFSELCLDPYSVAVERVRYLLDESVRLQLDSDVPVGALLSGGIDSSAIVGCASRYKEKLDTYTAIFDFEAKNSEAKLAALVAKKNRTNHHELHISAFDVRDSVLASVNWHDEPFADAANLPLYLISRELKKSVKVILQGDGGDELFAGYNRYYVLASPTIKMASKMLGPFYSLLSRYEKTKHKARILEILAEKNEIKKFALMLTVETERNSPCHIFHSAYIKNFSSCFYFSEYKNIVSEIETSFDDVQKMLLTDLNIILPCTFLEKVDKPTMANSVEVRVPFLDNELVNYVKKLPSTYKIYRGNRKCVLKDAMQDIIPLEVLSAKKRGFGVPYGFWLKTGLNDLLRHFLVLAEKKFSDRFNIIVLNRLYNEFMDGKRHDLILWKFFIFMIWIAENPYVNF